MHELYFINNDELIVEISSYGAEIVSVKDKNGKERIWQGKQGVWNEHAPILFPVCGGLKDDSYYIDGEKYNLPKHGFAKNTKWQLWKKTENSAFFILNEKTEGFPFTYKLFAKYNLNGNSIEVEYKCVNEDTRTFWYCIGSHEGYAINGKIDDYVIELEKIEDIYLSRQIGNLLIPEEYLFAENTCRIPLKKEYFANGAMIMRSIKSRSITLKCKEKKIVSVDYPDMGVIIIWAKPGEGFICIEPWTAAPDLITTDGVIAHKLGSVELHPAEFMTHKHTITYHI